jgi:hypothetical protein
MRISTRRGGDSAQATSASRDELEQLKRGIALADRAVQLAREEITQDSGANLVKFDVAAAPFQKTIGP